MLTGTIGQADQRAYLYTMHGDPPPPLTASIDQRIAELLYRGASPVTAPYGPETLREELTRRQPEDVIIISADPGPALLKFDPDGAIAKRFGLEVLNVRLTTVPFYVIAPERWAPSRGRPMRIGYYAPSAPSLGTDAIQGLVAPLLGIETLTAVQVSDPRAMALGLLAPAGDVNHIDLVGIYDADPSVFLDTFLSQYTGQKGTQSLKARLISVSPTTAPAQSPQYFVVPYESAALHGYVGLADERIAGGLLALPREYSGAVGDYPVILTNLRRVAGDQRAFEFARGLGDIYFMALHNLAEHYNRCAGPWSPLYQTYLLAAHLTDRSEPLKSLGLWGHYWMMAERKSTEKARYQAQVRILERMLGTLSIPVSDTNKLRDWVKNRAEFPVREQFSGDTSVMYDDGVKAIRDSLQPGASTETLHVARKYLLAAAFAHPRPSCLQAGNALRSTKNYDPYFHLEVIESLLRLRAGR